MMDDRKTEGYPVYSLDVLGGLQSVASAGECTGLQPTPPQTQQEDESYAQLGGLPLQQEKSATDKSQKRRGKGRS